MKTLDEDPYFQMLTTAKQLGIEMISKERQYQLLACCHLYGDESFVFCKRLQADTFFAADNNDIRLAGMPSEDVIEKIRKYENDLRQKEKPEWLLKLEDDYQVSFNEVI